MTSILTPYAPALHPVFNGIDRVLTSIPLVRLMAWIFTFELVKSVDEKSFSEIEPPL